MSKRMDDMVPQERRTVRDIPIERVNRSEISENQKHIAKPNDLDAETKLPPKPPTPVAPSKSHHRPWGVWGFALLVVLLVIGIGASVIFAGATVVVTPRTQPFMVDASLPASQDDTVGALRYEVVTVTDEVSKSIPATGEEFVESRAAGTIIIYNNFSSEPQKLIANTRFQTDDGLIYRIKDAVVVPGMEGSGDDATPGSLEVDVRADEVGAEYNVGLVDFTIPGFEGQPQFFKFFARSKTPMTGGFSGTRKIVDATEEQQVRDELQADLNTRLYDLAAQKVPEGSFIVEGSAVVTFEAGSQEASEDGETATIVERGELRAYVVDETTLASFIARQSIGTYDGAPVHYTEDSAVAITIAPATESDEASVVVNGKGTLEWTFDEDQLKKDFAGAGKDEAQMILTEYRAIDDARISLRPFWKRSFPQNPDRITIVYAEGLTE